MVMKSDNRSGIVHHCRHKNIPGVNTDTGDSTGSNNMYPIDFIFAIQGNNAEFLDCFGFEVEDGLEGIKTGQKGRLFGSLQGHSGGVWSGLA
jgi:hypothetical protein